MWARGYALRRIGPFRAYCEQAVLRLTAYFVNQLLTPFKQSTPLIVFIDVNLFVTESLVSKTLRGSKLLNLYISLETVRHLNGAYSNGVLQPRKIIRTHDES